MRQVRQRKQPPPNHKKTANLQGEWDQPFQLWLDKNLAAAMPTWIARIHVDFTTLGGLLVMEGESLYFNTWSVANLLEWTDTSEFGELEPLRLRRLAVAAL